MNHQIELIEIPNLREITERIVVKERPVSEEDLKSVRLTLDTMIRDAARYGFTEADVIRAVLSPVLKPREGCECASCRTRREMEDDFDEEISETPLGFD